MSDSRGTARGWAGGARKGEGQRRDEAGGQNRTGWEEFREAFQAEGRDRILVTTGTVAEAGEECGEKEQAFWGGKGAIEAIGGPGHRGADGVAVGRRGIRPPVPCAGGSAGAFRDRTLEGCVR